MKKPVIIFQNLESARWSMRLLNQLGLKGAAIADINITPENFRCNPTGDPEEPIPENEKIDASAKISEEFKYKLMAEIERFQKESLKQAELISSLINDMQGYPPNVPDKPPPPPPPPKRKLSEDVCIDKLISYFFDGLQKQIQSGVVVTGKEAFCSKTKPFKFHIKANVKINCSGEKGKIRGRAEYQHGQRQYYILYKAGDGRAVSDWWGEDEISLVE